MLHYFKFGSNSCTTESTAKQSPVRALPSSWYTSQQMFDFERRAIFSNRWLFMTHKSRLQNSGDWLRYTFAGFDIIIDKDHQGNVNAFHNVCRHRAYPVIDKEGCGSAKILACRYHGWSYGLDGKLAKAPGYAGLEFKKEENSLLRCHVKIDRNGFVWVNLDAKETPEVAWEDHFRDVDMYDVLISLDTMLCANVVGVEDKSGMTGTILTIMRWTIRTNWMVHTTGRYSPTTSTNATTVPRPILIFPLS